MARRARIGILRARHDASVGTIKDQACLEMFFHNNGNTAVFDYWQYVTRGWLDFRNSELMPWVDITLTLDEVLKREVHGQKAYAALSMQVGAIPSGFDGWIVLTHPGTVVVANPDAGKPNQPATITLELDGGAGYSLAGAAACSLPVMTGNHTFYCHELGHVLGFKHTYGLFNNGIDWDGRPPFDQGQVYGDPYDLMSSASFGTRNLDLTLKTWRGSPVFSRSVPAEWPNPNGMGSMGPAPSSAHLHQWDERMFPPGTVKALPYPLQGQTLRVRLTSAGRNSAATSLLMLRAGGTDLDREGRGRIYVEYRGKDGWDLGLHESGTDLARRAVVAHTLADTSNDGVRTWYGGRVVVPTETDTDVAPIFTPLVVRVTWVAEDNSAADVEVTTSAAREVEIRPKVFTAELAANNPEVRHSPCGDELIWATRIQQTTMHFTVSTRGYGGTGDPGVTSPQITWTVGGITIPSVQGSGSIEVPTTEGTFTVKYDLTLDPAVLVLVGRGGERYSTEVKATATEPDGDFGHFAVAMFSPVGWTEGFGPDDLDKLTACLKSRFGRVHVRDRDWLLPVPPEDPDWGRRAERINLARIQELARRVQDENPGIAADLTRIAQLRREHLDQR
jgi:hypothetical protein